MKLWVFRYFLFHLTCFGYFLCRNWNQAWNGVWNVKSWVISHGWALACVKIQHSRPGHTRFTAMSSYAQHCATSIGQVHAVGISRQPYRVHGRNWASMVQQWGADCRGAVGMTELARSVRWSSKTEACMCSEQGRAEGAKCLGAVHRRRGTGIKTVSAEARLMVA